MVRNLYGLVLNMNCRLLHLVWSIIGHKNFSCPSPPQAVQLVNYNISLRANFISSPRMVSQSPSNSDSRVSTDSQGPTGSTASMDGCHASESNHLQLVTHCSQSQISEHVAAPPLVVDNYIAQDFPTKHVALKQPCISLENLKEDTWKGSCDFSTLHPIRYTAADKGKSPLLLTQATPPAGPYSIINEVDFFYPFSPYHNIPSSLDSSITQIQEIHNPQVTSQPVQFKDFLAAWAESTNKPLFISPPPSFQIGPPLNFNTFPSLSLPPTNIINPSPN